MLRSGDITDSRNVDINKQKLTNLPSNLTHEECMPFSEIYAPRVKRLHREKSAS